jgi:hypothetical protein
MKKELNKDPDGSKKIDECRKGRIKVSKWENDKGVSYSLTIGYKKEDQWLNKKITLFPSEIPDVINALKDVL